MTKNRSIKKREAKNGTTGQKINVSQLNALQTNGDPVLAYCRISKIQIRNFKKISKLKNFFKNLKTSKFHPILWVHGLGYVGSWVRLGGFLG